MPKKKTPGSFFQRMAAMDRKKTLNDAIDTIDAALADNETLQVWRETGPRNIVVVEIKDWFAER